MTDWLIYPEAHARPASAVAPTVVRAWLWSLAGLVLLLVMVGGATRLTWSGLSITEWRPVTGIVPPLSQQQWLLEFEKYRQIPQYRDLFPDMDLDGFRFIYLWEWAHRLIARLLGLAIVLPTIAFWVSGQLSSRLRAPLVGLVALVGLQGAVGWWMVASGLSARTEVAQERLAIHLLLASATLGWTVWLAAGESSERRVAVGTGLRLFAGVLPLLVFVQIGWGGLVAGLRAGLTYNTWPLMDGKIVPPLDHLLNLSPWWSNLLDNATTVQFAHRMMGYVVLLGILAYSLLALCADRIVAKRGMRLLTLVCLQVVVGIVTLIYAVPLHAALCHQALAMVLLGACVWNVRSLAA